MTNPPDKTAVSDAVARMSGAAARAGIREEDPDAQLIQAMGQLALGLEERMRALGQQFADQSGTASEEIQREMRRIAGEALRDAAQQSARRGRWTLVACAALVAVGALGVGAAAGWTAGIVEAGQRSAWVAADLQNSFRSGLAGAEWLAEAVRVNSPAAMSDECRRSTFTPSAGGTACTVHLWTSHPTAKGTGS